MLIIEELLWKSIWYLEIYNPYFFWTMPWSNLLVFEVIFYGCNIILLYLYIIPTIGGDIKRKCLQVRSCRQRLHSREPLFPGLSYEVDTADGQWSNFRNSLSIMMIALVTSFALKRLLRFSRRIHQLSRLIFGFIFVMILHRYHSLILIGIIIISYLLFQSLKYKPTMLKVVTWTLGLGLLLAKESYRLQGAYPVLRLLFDQRRYGGMYAWQYSANFFVLRLISYGVDLSSSQGAKEYGFLPYASSFSSSRDDPRLLFLFP